MSAQSAYQAEETRLAEAVEDIKGQLGGIGPRYTGDDFTEQMLDLQREERRQRLEIARKEAYFGRIDFQEEGKPAPLPLYIGKAGVARAGSDELLVIDWRAPVASLFYSFSGGEAPVTYDSPDGEIGGTVHLKRNLMVRQKELLRLVDSFVRGQEEDAVTDEFLLYRLGESKDNKLRDIVSTIQQEQDKIIRADKNLALFIQGVAGSGKTTVALHRLAFLLYQYAGRIRSERMIIFAPNRMFLDYISGVLPELGVGDIVQTTFADWAIELLEREVMLRSPVETLAYWFEQPHAEEEYAAASGRLKGSAAFKEALDGRLAELEASLLPAEPFEPLPGFKLTVAKMKEWHETDYGEESIMRRRERLVSRVKRWLESELKQRGVADKKLRSKAMAKLNAFSKRIPAYSAPQLYRKLLEGKSGAQLLPAPLAKATAARLKQGEAEAEDLAPLVYLHIRLHGLGRPFYDHIVIDEAQDYSPFQLEALRLCQQQPSMTVLGDLQQGIHAYAGISDWSELSGRFDEGSAGYFELDRSYRSTTEIIDFANLVLAGMGSAVKPAVPVFRSGDPVVLERVSADGWAPRLAAVVADWQREGRFQTIAVIGRTERECADIHAALESAGIEAALVHARQPAYGGGLTVVPAYLSKGLEFDAVLVADASAEAYGAADAKLLYVACTRALHRLGLLHRGEPAVLLG
ncbi:UvrD-helicase domain-containing protein [Paenibacillus sp. FSL W8-1187]|uniref:HelD family protein n=1 Tax=unclassified Paenibacillus TaxID=185978 RepID=UPI00129B52AD|nr:UvrD-helicase domain-containing protein [Paenibacillus sp. B01]QGG56564.1 AAA family ATPase [Paenibacillus sp. B01]